MQRLNAARAARSTISRLQPLRPSNHTDRVNAKLASASFESATPGARTLPQRFTTLEQRLTALRRAVAAPLLRSFVSLVAARMMEGPPSLSQATKPQGGMQAALARPGPTLTAVHKFLAKSGRAEAPGAFADAMDSNTALCNDRERGNDDARLAALAQDLADLGAVSLLQASMPLECDVLQHYKELL